jgi:hypothetical protein
MLARIALSDLLPGVAPEPEKASPSPTLSGPAGTESQVLLFL